MPFIEQAFRPQIETGSNIIGRTNEQYFFTEHVLRPVEPAYNLISVWGEAGVGKSTLLTRSRDTARSTEFKDVCLTALVDEWPVTPAHLMERVAVQLRSAGAPLVAFEQALARLRHGAPQQQPEQAFAQAALRREIALFQQVLGYQAPLFPGSPWVSPVLSSIIYWYCGWVFLSGAVAELRAGRPGMMTLVALAISTAYFYSLAITVGLVAGMPFYWELATLVTIMLLGHWMEMRAIGSAHNALRELAKLLPDLVERIADGRTEEVPVRVLQEGDLVLVRPGGQVPADGEVAEGESQVNESMITGESRPVDKRSGDEVIAGTVNGTGSLRVRVTRTGEQTMLAGIMRLVEEAQHSKSRAQALADKTAFWLTLIAVAMALLALIIWTLLRGFGDYTLERVVSTLVVACPHALGLAIPLVIAITTALSARNGILVRDRLALERARSLDVVIFDKTGTLSKGEQGLVGIATAEGLPEEQALAEAAAVEGESEHMIARAIVASTRERNLRVPPVRNFQALPGRGVQAKSTGAPCKSVVRACSKSRK